MQRRKTPKRILALFMVWIIATLSLTDVMGSNVVYAEENAPSVSYTTHVQTFGWQEDVSDGELSGTEGLAKRLEGIKIKVDSELSGGIEYSVHCQTYGWMDYVSDYELAGTTGESKRLESIKIRLTGELAEEYDVLYRVHRQTYGWTDWVKNDEEAGTTGESKRLEAIQIKLVKKGEEPYARIKYTTHVQGYGWMPYSYDGEVSGTEGESKRIEAIKIDVETNLTGGVHYFVDCQSYGPMDSKGNGDMAGTVGQSKRLEALQIRLTGELAEYYEVFYRAHCQSYGWFDWGISGGPVGTKGLGKRMEAVQIMLYKKGEGPEITGKCYDTLEEYLERTPEVLTGKQKEIVEYAKQFVGVPYVYGGNSLTEGTDCSGFTMLVYQHFGYYLPHNADWQADYGRQVNVWDIQPGDLIFYKRPGEDSIYHVSMYIGNNKIIHQSGPGGSCRMVYAGIYRNGVGFNENICKVVRIIE